MEKRFVFIVGAGRSGTTLLYKLLALHPQVGFTSNYNERLPRWPSTALLTTAVRPLPTVKRIAWFEEGGNAYFIQRPWLKRLCPTPVEAESIYRDCGIPEVPDPDYQLLPSTRQRFRRRFQLLSLYAGGKVFVDKRTNNNLRIRWLHQVFPEALFVHLIRDGRAVAHSLSRVHWWPTHTVWWSGETPVAMERHGLPPMATCARNWVRDVQAIREGLRFVPPRQVFELRYETLTHEPWLAQSMLWEFLGLSERRSRGYQWRELGLRADSDGWRKAWDSKTLDIVHNEQRELLADLGYV